MKSSSALLKHNSNAFDILIDANARMDVNDFFIFLFASVNIRHQFMKHFFDTVNINAFIYMPNTIFNGCTALHLAVMYNDPLFVKILIDRGADINCRNVNESWTILKYILNVKNQYLFIKFCGTTELTNIHSVFTKKLPNMCIIIKMLLHSGTQLALDFVECFDIDNILRYVREQNHIPHYDEILRILIKFYARREFLNEFNFNKELRSIIQNYDDVETYYHLCNNYLMKLKKQNIISTKIPYIEMLKRHSLLITNHVRLVLLPHIENNIHGSNVYYEEINDKVGQINAMITNIHKVRNLVCRMFSNKINADSIIVEMIVNYLNDEDLMNLLSYNTI